MSKLLYNIFVPRKTGYCFDETGLSDVEIKQLYDKLWNIPHITIWGGYQNIQYIIGLIKDNNIYYSIGVDDGIYPVFEVVISQQDYNKISNIVTNKYQLIEINDDYVQWYYGLISYLLNDTSPLISYDNNWRNYNQTQVEHYEALIYPLYKKYSYIVDNDKLDDVISYFKKVFAQTDSNYYQSRVKEYSYENLELNHTEYVDKLRLDNSINYFQTEGYPTTPQIISYEVQAKLCNQSMITWVELDNGNTVSDKIMKKHNITVYPNEQLYIDKQNLIKSLSVKQESVNTSTPQIITQDILSVQSGIIAHQVNCQGVMGAGLAKQIRDKFPKAYDAYMESFKQGKLKLGTIKPCTIIDKQLYIYNMCGQDRYGKDGKQYTDYDALATCLSKLHQKSIELGLTPYLPYNLGCGYGGGKWEIVYELISKHCPNAVICKLPDKSNKPVQNSTPQIHQPTVQTSVQEEQHPVASIDQEAMMYIDNYNDTFSYEGHQDYQEVYIPTTEDSPTPQQPVVATPPKQYDLSKEYMDKFNNSGLNLFTNATVHNWQ